MTTKAPRGEKITIELVRPYAMLILGIALFGGGGAFMIHRSLSNDRGLILNGIVHLEPGGADAFYAAIGALSVAMGILSAFGLGRMATRKSFRIVLAKQSMTIPEPRMWRALQEITVRYDDIVAVRLHPPGAPSFVILETHAGRHHLSKQWLPPAWPASLVASTIVGRLRARADAPVK